MPQIDPPRAPAPTPDTLLWRALQPLRSVIGFMNTGAHPDDECSRMLAVLALRDGFRVSILCSTRGEGGQNALGPETVRDLGVIRTREMELACAELGAALYWLSEGPDDPIFDFGFSKSGDETLARWGHERVVARFVRALRTERPDIVCPTFLDVPGQHGHHRAMTRAAFDAVRLAADPAHKDGLAPWQVAKLYLPAWSGAGTSYDDDLPPPPATVTVLGTGTDPVLGADYAQIGEWSRAWHQTQKMGRQLPPGTPNDRELHLAWAASGNLGPESAITEGLPRSLADLGLAEAQAGIDAALAGFPNRAAVRAGVLRALAALGPVAPEHAHRIATKRRQLARVVALASGLTPRLVLIPATARPGEAVRAEVDGLGGLNPTVRIVAPEGWTVSERSVEIPFSFPGPTTIWDPDRPNASIHAVLDWEEDGIPIALSLAPETPLLLLPPVTARLTPPAALLNLARPAPVSVVVTETRPEGAPDFALPSGWTARTEGGSTTFLPEAEPAPGLLAFPLRLNGTPAATVTRMDFPHTGPLIRAAPAILRLRVLKAEFTDTRVAYVGGGSDRSDAMLRAAGLAVETLDDAALASADFAAYGAVLIGIFAARTRPGLAARIDDLHRWVRAGGTLVTLYHPPWDNWDILPLAPVTIGQPSLRWRVTDEAAPVTLLDPAHPVFNAPNRIGPEDWDGWQKERGLYFASAWDAAYQPLVELADPGEAPHRGALLSGRFGTGRHAHCSLILHHQLAELVPGAYRLMANLLAPEG